jgi:uncharacterized membrane protein
MGVKSWLSERTYWRRAPALTVLIAVGAFVLLFSWLQFRLYDAFRLGLRDLGFFMQSLDALLRGVWFTVRQGYTDNTAVSYLFYAGWEERSLFSEHVYLLYLLNLPLYAWLRTPHSWFVLNAIAVGGAALPLYLLARRQLQHDWAAACVSLAYLLHPAVQVATLGEYVYGPHPDNFAPFCLFALLYFAERRRARSFWLMGLLALSTVESLAPTVAAIALYLSLTQPLWRKHSLALCFVATAFFGVATLLIIPAAGGGRAPYYFAALKTWGAALNHPEAFLPLWEATQMLATVLLVPLALLPLLGGSAWLIALPELLSGWAAQTLGYPIPMEYGSWHVWAYVIAAFVALMRVCKRLQKRAKPVLVYSAWACVFALEGISLWLFGPYPFSRDVWPLTYSVDPAKLAFVSQTYAAMPHEASLSVEFFLGSHGANRPNVYWFPVYWRDADYVLVDAEPWAWQSEDDQRILARAQRSSYVELIAQHEPKVFFFKHKPAPPLQHSLNRAFANGIELVGYSLATTELKPNSELAVTLFWRTREKLPLNLTVFAHLLDVGGQVVGQRDSQPDNGTYPTTEWTLGTLVVDQRTFKVATGARAGSALLEVGLYDLQTGTRVLTTAGADKVILAGIVIQ